MCILPNFEPADLEELKKNRKKENQKAETVEMVISEQTLEKPI
jgi:hypothetical protein